MSLFKKKKQNDSSESGNGFLPPDRFYTLCVKDYHDYAKELGYAEKGVIFIPELIPLGQQAVISFYKNDEIQRQFNRAYSPDEAAKYYYYTAVDRAIRCGIKAGYTWHLDFPTLKQSGLLETIMADPMGRLTAGIIRENLEMETEEFMDFSMDIYLHWSEMHQPYWNLRDPRHYTVYATLAAYQLGISMILSKFGFGKE